MKVSSAKPISSPGRAEKFPPPLMRFLRSNVGSRSRGRSSRTSPLFTRKKTTSSAAAAAETSQEPSSPKVTCIGQVRVRRSVKKAGAERKRPTIKNHCCCVVKPNFCNSMNAKLRPKSIRHAWRKWAFFSGCTSAETRTHSSENESNRSNRVKEIEDDEKEEEVIEVKRGREFALSSSTPPKNVLLLTRCRSAPYRSSSLAGRFWGSPTKTEDAEKPEQENGENRTILASETEPIGTDSTAEPRRDRENEGNLGFREGLVENSQETRGKTEELGAFDVARPPLMVLRRCNSETARRSEKFDPEDGNLESRRRLAFTESSTLHVD